MPIGHCPCWKSTFWENHFMSQIKNASGAVYTIINSFCIFVQNFLFLCSEYPFCKWPFVPPLTKLHELAAKGNLQNKQNLIIHNHSTVQKHFITQTFTKFYNHLYFGASKECQNWLSFSFIYFRRSWFWRFWGGEGLD